MTRRAASLALLAILATGCGRAGVGRRYVQQVDSMAPTIRRGDTVACTRGRPERVSRGDVIVFDGAKTGFPTRRALIYRVVALPGETISGDASGSVTVHGRPLDEPYAAVRGSWAFGPVAVPEDAYFVMGDNRERSSDSRVNGPVPHASVIARCVRIAEPPSRRGPIARSSDPDNPAATGRDGAARA